MKILVPFFQVNGNNTLDDKIITGGIDRFIQLLYLNYGLAEIIPVYYNENDRKKRLVTKKVISAIYNHSPDMMIVNYDTPTLLGSIYKKFNLPILWMTHSCSGGIGRIKQAQMMKEFEEFGGVLGMVSDWQFQSMNTLSKRIQGSELKLLGGTISPSYATGQENVSEIDNDLISIGRCNVAKDPFLAHKYADMTGLSSIVHTNLSYESERDQEYYESNAHWELPHLTKLGKPYSEVMDDLSRSRIYISSHIAESWGITIFESLVRGVPVLVKTDHTLTHAADEICADSNHIIKYKGKPKSDQLSELFKKFKSLKHSDRIIISEATKEKHSFTNWQNRMSDMIDKTLSSKYKTNYNMNTLEDYV